MAEIAATKDALNPDKNTNIEKDKIDKILEALDNKKSTFKADFAKYLVNNYVRQQLEHTNWKSLADTGLTSTERNEKGLPTKQKMSELPPPEGFSIGIIGAGIAGLYTALICETLELDWHIIEANPNRLGGRLYTKYMDEKESFLHDYYDIGAMRYPNTPVMERTFKLFKMTRTRLGDYLMKSGEEAAPSRYNDRTNFRQPEPVKDFFKVSKTNEGPVPDDAVANPDLILGNAYNRFRQRIKNAYATNEPSDQKAAWEYLLKHDRFSLRDYLTFVEGEDFETTHWLETLNAGTGWFDQAFSEHVLETLAFEYYDEGEKRPIRELDSIETAGGQPSVQEQRTIGSLLPVDSEGPDSRLSEGDWYYIQNGSTSLVINTMRKIQEVHNKDGKELVDLFYPKVKSKDAFPYVKDRITQGKRVIKIGRREVGSGKQVAYSDLQPLTVSYVNTEGSPGKIETKDFDVVINTTTLSAMQKMDLLDLDVPYDTKAAIRMLRYDTSTKVAIRFKSRWWCNQNSEFKIKVRGGLGKTDMPLRTCVYPSYNVDDKATNSTVLLCSYTWGADSERIASMIKGMKTAGGEKTDELAVVMLDNLARLHTTNDEDYKKLLAFITEDFDRYHAYDWSNDPYTCGGAFALFSAHQFSRLYPALVRPLADARLHIVGEAASAHHAWVVGALDSAVRGLRNAFTRLQMFDQIKKMEDIFGGVGEIDEDTDYIQIAIAMAKAGTKGKPMPKPTAATAA